MMVLLISQKTLVLTAAIATSLPESMGDSGLILVPCFIAHPLQVAGPLLHSAPPTGSWSPAS